MSATQVEQQAKLTWSAFVKQYSKYHGITYQQGMRVCKEAWEEYKKGEDQTKLEQTYKKKPDVESLPPIKRKPKNTSFEPLPKKKVPEKIEKPVARGRPKGSRNKPKPPVVQPLEEYMMYNGRKVKITYISEDPEPMEESDSDNEE